MLNLVLCYPFVTSNLQKRVFSFHNQIVINDSLLFVLAHHFPLVTIELLHKNKLSKRPPYGVEYQNLLVVVGVET